MARKNKKKVTATYKVLKPFSRLGVFLKKGDTYNVGLGDDQTTQYLLNNDFIVKS